MQFIARFAFSVLVLLILAEVYAGVRIDSLFDGFIAVAVLGLVNTLVRPILFILTLPITIITLGLFAFVLNALLFLFVANVLEGFYVAGFWAALLGSLVLTLGNMAGRKWLG
jgi:putative membrane protein